MGFCDVVGHQFTTKHVRSSSAVSVNSEFSFLIVMDASSDSNRTLFITSFCHRSANCNDSCTRREDFTRLWFFPFIKVVYEYLRSEFSGRKV